MNIIVEIIPCKEFIEDKTDAEIKEQYYEKIFNSIVEISDGMQVNLRSNNGIRLEQPVKPTLAEEAHTLLSLCKTKLQLYRANVDGQYLGGVEYTELMRRIDEWFSKCSL